ncbi:sulfotransferase family protein [Brevundimonas diminuta]|uniref:sulfotransferase family protein n=1 Tax=Brevundimonas diminuta TaxID=293 RepID=UPI003CFEAE61
MHRSGTSSVAGALTLAGAAAPRHLMPAAEDNPRGFWESSAVADFNDRLLAREGSNWHDWRAFSTAAAEGDGQLRAEAADLLRQEFGDAPTIALKDPRICRLFLFWRRALTEAGYAPVVVSPFRPPSEVAASLVSRNTMGRSHALRLWMRHVLDAERASRGLPRRFIMWPDFLNNWRHDFAAISRLCVPPLDLDGRASAEIDAFLSSDLHRQSDASPVPAAVALVHDRLVQLSRHGDHADLHRSMDDLRTAFNQACVLFEDAPR